MEKSKKFIIRGAERILNT
ncbi:MAG TPA: hypothetical protein LFW21_02470 [Rickettsia endosymbiont of Pyrocoelia pectoralis]|nr:hypothetical protein [Rickettsia endosymbiont of Pyrocoelia pectoralis]